MGPVGRGVFFTSHPVFAMGSFEKTGSMKYVTAHTTTIDSYEKRQAFACGRNRNSEVGNRTHGLSECSKVLADAGLRGF